MDLFHFRHIHCICHITLLHLNMLINIKVLWLSPNWGIYRLTISSPLSDALKQNPACPSLWSSWKASPSKLQVQIWISHKNHFREALYMLRFGNGWGWEAMQWNVNNYGGPWMVTGLRYWDTGLLPMCNPLPHAYIHVDQTGSVVPT